MIYYRERGRTMCAPTFMVESTALKYYNVNVLFPCEWMERIVNMRLYIRTLVFAVALLLVLLCGCSQRYYKAEITMQDGGVIRLELDSKMAPKTVENFVNLAKDGF